MICWIPITLIIFLTRRPIRQALLLSMIVTWLVLPPSGLEIPGFPDYTKATAASIGGLLSVMIFDGNRLMGFRPKWYDLPILIFCLTPISSSVVNDLGAYDGFSASFINFVWFGVPYFLGRIYLSDQDSLASALTAFVIGTLFYALPTLWEIRMSPQLQTYFYGLANPYFHPARFGLGYRPIVFMTTGLELGLWIAFAAIFAYAMHVGRSPMDIRGISLRWITICLVGLSLLTKSVGAIALMILGIALVRGTKVLGRTILLWALVVIPVLYVGTRMSGIWSGENLVEFSRLYLGEDRASSLQARFDNEDRLITRAMERPILGWGGHGRSRVYNEYGRDITLSDGLWVIYLGTEGMVGLAALLLTFLVPQVGILLKTRGPQWRLPGMQLVAASVVFCGLFLIDSLLNSNPNPVYFMLIGGLSGFSAIRRTSALEEASAYLRMGDQLTEAEEFDEAEVAYHLALRGFSKSRTGDPFESIGMGESHRCMGQLLVRQGREEEAEAEFLAAVAVYEDLASQGTPLPSVHEPWSSALDSLARHLRGQGRQEEAEAFWRRSLEVLEGALAGATPGDHAWRLYADRLNDLAWHLAFPGGSGEADLEAAVVLARRATTIHPEEACFWNSLGVALLYAGDDRGAIEAISKSVALAGGGNGFDYYVMAMACARVGEHGVAEQWFHQGEAWRASEGTSAPDLERVRGQAEAMIAATKIQDPGMLLPYD